MNHGAIASCPYPYSFGTKTKSTVPAASIRTPTKPIPGVSRGLRLRRRDMLPLYRELNDRIFQAGLRAANPSTPPQLMQLNFRVPIAPSFHAKVVGLDAPPSANTAKYIPSYLSLTIVSISTNIQRTGEWRMLEFLQDAGSSASPSTAPGVWPTRA